MLKTSKIAYIGNIVEGFLVIVLIVLVLFMIVSVNNIQGNARVVNYAGIVRGATQRVVKLEISQQPNNDLINNINTILLSLQNGGGPYKLTELQDEVYLNKLSEQVKIWEALKQEITLTRLYGVENTNILELSETYYNFANDTVSAAEAYSEGKVNQLKQLEIGLFIIISCILILLLNQTILAIRLSRKNRKLNRMAYIDVNTGLPNKGRCDQMFLEYGILSNEQEFAGIMFDLNNLKVVNDTFGHKAGDALILNFANILRRCASEKVFVGRYGGDEFIAILYDTNEEEVKVLLDDIEVIIQEFNKGENGAVISYAHGYELSGLYVDCTLQVLMDKADKNMYVNKEIIKKRYKNKK